jgi:peptidyl-prolyl cis-trans isomerase D
MFDLFRSSQKSKRILLSAVLGVVALSMLLYLIPGAGSMAGRSDDQTVAEIGTEVVTVRQVETQIRNAFRGGQVSPEVAAAIVPQIVEQAITDRALAYEAKRLGFQVTDSQLASTIRSFGQVGNLTPQQYRLMIEEQANTTVPEFENGIRLNSYFDNLQKLALEGAFVSPDEVAAEYRRRNEMAKLDYIAFDPTKFTDQIKPTPQELKDYFEKNKAFFSAPETRNVQLVVVDQVKVAEAFQVSDAQVQSYYNSHRDQYRTKERVKARHILISILNKPPAEVPKLKAKAEDLLKQIKAGADFAKLAEKNSDDKTTAPKGGDLGWVMRGQMMPEFEKATFELKPNQISDVIPVNYGFHIVQVLEKEEAHLRPIEEVRTEIVSGLKNQTIFDRMQALADQARAQLARAPQNAREIAGKLGLTFASVDKFKSGDTIPELGKDAQVGGSIASLQKGAVSQVLQSGEKLVVAVVTSVNPPHPAEFAEVESQVRDRYNQEKAVQLADEKAKKAAEVAKANGGDLRAAAKSVGLEVKSTNSFNRTGAAEGIGDARYLGDAFDKPVGTVIGPLNVGTQKALVKIVDKASPDMSKIEQERQMIVDQLKKKKSSERADMLRDSVVSYLAQKGKVKIHQDVMERLKARYRS